MLDDKLLKIIANNDLHGDKLAQIKQAFADEGWHKPHHWAIENGEPVEAMTGQEFYDRFNNEIETLIQQIPDIAKKLKDWGMNKEALAAIIGHDLDRAAKRAAGLTDA